METFFCFVLDGGGSKLPLLTPDNYQEKLGIVDGMAGSHMAQWRAPQVLAWMRVIPGDIEVVVRHT